MNLSYRDANFIEKVSKRLIKNYESFSGKEYKNEDINSIKEVVQFLKGEVIYLDIKEKYNIDKMLYLKENDKFVIVIDKSFVNNKLISEEKEIILDMMWKYLQSNIHFNLYANTLIYPENSNIDENEIRELLDKNVKKYIKK